MFDLHFVCLDGTYSLPVTVILRSPAGVSNKDSWLSTAYSVLPLLPLTFCFTCASMSLITFVHENITNTVVAVLGVSLSLFHCTYFLTKADSVRSLACNWNSASRHMSESGLFNETDFNKIVVVLRKVNIVRKYFLLILRLVTVSMFLHYYVCHVLYKSNDLMFPVPYNVHAFPGLFTFTLGLQGFTMIYGSTQILSPHCSFLCITVYLTVCFSRLQISCERIFQSNVLEITHLCLFNEEMYCRKNKSAQQEAGLSQNMKAPTITAQFVSHRRSNFKRNRKLFYFKNWVDVHDEMLRLVRQMNKVYSPVLGFQLVNYFLLCLSMILMARAGSSTIQACLHLGFVILYLVTLFAMCYCGSQLTHQCSTILEDVYDKSKLYSDHQVSKCALIAGAIVNKSVRISAYGSEYFDLSINTFLWMVQSMASAYISLAQIQKLNRQ